MSVDVRPLDDDAEVVNLANGNFATLWSALGLDPTPDGQLDAHELLRRLDDLEVRPELAVRAESSLRDRNGRVLGVNCGLDESYVRTRVQALRRVARRAVSQGSHRVEWS